MRIEISSNGFGGASVSELQSNFTTYVADTDKILCSFKTIKESTLGLNGGVETLQHALDNVEARLSHEEDKHRNAKTVQTKVNEFVQLVARVDDSVSRKVDKNRDEFYKTNSWLKPIASVEPKASWYEQAWNWLCDSGKMLSNGAKIAWNWVKDSATKAWNGLVKFYSEHKNLCKATIGVLAIGAAVLVTIATGGAAAALPALLMMAKSAIIGGAITAVIEGGLAFATGLCNEDDLEKCFGNSFDKAIDGFFSGFMFGAILSTAGQIYTCIIATPATKSVTVAAYKNMPSKKNINGQAHHLHQDAAFGSVIPKKEGLCVELEGNVFSDVGSPHNRFHSSLESYWDAYRKGGALYGTQPKMGTYNDALYEALLDAGLTKTQAKQVVNAAISQQTEYGLALGDFVPRIPGRMHIRSIK